MTKPGASKTKKNPVGKAKSPNVKKIKPANPPKVKKPKSAAKVQKKVAKLTSQLTIKPMSSDQKMATIKKIQKLASSL